jgi:drug/metabolite transporter (DMT)-like permease
LGAVALTLYGMATVFWILLLRSAPLGKLYPYMALSFVFVAAASWLLFGEAISAGYLSGLALIVVGLLVIAISSGP